MNVIPLSLRSSANLLTFARRKLVKGKHHKALQAVDLLLKRISAGQVSFTNLSQAWEAWLLKGHIHRDLAEYSAATVAFLIAHALLPVDDDALEFLAGELSQKEDITDVARTVYLDYLSSNAARDASRNKRNLQRLEALSRPRWNQSESLDTTMDWNEAIRERRPDLAWPHQHIGIISLAFSDWYAAVDSLQQAYNLNRSKVETIQTLAYALFRVGRFQDAKTHLDKLISVAPSNGAILLRAHVHRALKNFAAAVRDFRQVSETNGLTDEERLSYAEVCVNAGYFDEAVRELEQIDLYYDARWLLLRALVDEAAQYYEEALAKLDQVISMDEQLAAQAVPHVLQIIAANPELPECLDMLEAVPHEYRYNSYWTIKGNVLLTLGRTDQVFAAWREVAYPDDELRETLTVLERHHLATLYNQNRDLDIIRILRNELILETYSDYIAEIIVSSLSRYVRKNLSVTPRPKKFLKDIELVETWFPGYAGSERLDLIRALVYLACHNYEDASDIFCDLGPTTNDDINLQAARCAIHNGAWSYCMETLDAVRRKNQQANRVRCALAALKGDWDSALRHLASLQPEKDLELFNAAILFRADRYTELKNLNGSALNTAAYYRTAQLLQRGQDELAAQAQASIPAHDPHRDLSNRLFGWRHLQRASQFRASDNGRVAESLRAALILWPDSHGPAAYVKNLNANFMRSLLTGKDIDAFGAVLEADARRCGPADSNSCHNLGLFYLCNGARNAATDDFESTFESWQKAIAYISVALADEAYMAQWVQRRLQTYGIDQYVETQRIVDQVLRYFDDTFKTTSEDLASRGQTDEAAMLSDLVLALRAELRGAREVGLLGGFETPDAATKIYAGPIFVSMINCERTFARFLTSLKLKYTSVPETLPEDPLEALRVLVENWKAEEAEGAVEPSAKERLEKIYSAVRFAFVRQEEGNLEAALNSLREARLSFRTAATRRVNLAQRSPAFARKDGGKDFRNLVNRYEVELLTALGEHDVAATDNRIDSGVQYWRDALLRAQETGEYAWVAEKVREIAIGRSQFLLSKHEPDEAITLLEKVNDLCGDDLVRSRLSKIVAIRGVKANNDNEWEEAVEDLRYAVSLAPDSEYAQFNFSIILRNLVEEVRDTDPERAVSLLQEALAAVNKCVVINAARDDYWEAQVAIREELTWLRFQLEGSP